METGKLLVRDAAFFKADELRALDRTAIPRHIAIIPDGNRRWAQQQGASPAMGHRQGSQVVADTVKAAAELGVQVVTLYAFSTENWSRPKEEIEFLMALLEASLLESEAWMISGGVQLHAIGDLSVLPSRVLKQLESSIAKTQQGRGLHFNLAVNYGGRDEIRRAVGKIVRACKEGRLPEEQIDELQIASYMDTARWGDPDLLIRTSGECRVSNFLLWQLSYSEFYFTETLWPDFTPKHLLQAIVEYQRRAKRWGS